ncbi:MAG: hypothetical protein AMK72_13690, partial [Planctomycetes bacterium SM23_25]
RARLYKLREDDTLELLASNEGDALPITPDATEGVLIAPAAPRELKFTEDVVFSFVINGDEAGAVEVTLPLGETTNNQNVTYLVEDLKAALAAAGLGDRLAAGSWQGRITFAPAAGSGITALAIRDAEDLGFGAEQTLGDRTAAWPLDPVADLARVRGLTIHNPDDVDWFRFRLEGNLVAAGGTITLEQTGGDGALRVELLDDSGTVLLADAVSEGERRSTTSSRPSPAAARSNSTSRARAPPRSTSPSTPAPPTTSRSRPATACPRSTT